jgi:hypothetical protein
MIISRGSISLLSDGHARPVIASNSFTISEQLLPEVQGFLRDEDHLIK